MGESMYVTMESLRQLKRELEEALTNFNKSFSDLESGINGLVQSGFTGEGAQTLKNTFEGQPKASLEAVKRDTQNIIDYMEMKIGAFDRTLNSIDDIASSNR